MRIASHKRELQPPQPYHCLGDDYPQPVSLVIDVVVVRVAVVGIEVPGVVGVIWTLLVE